MIWIFPIAALAAFINGLARSAWRWALLAAMLYGPFALYLAAGPAFRWVGLLAWLLFVLAAVALRVSRRALAVGLAVPAFALAAYFAVLVAVTNPP